MSKGEALQKIKQTYGQTAYILRRSVELDPSLGSRPWEIRCFKATEEAAILMFIMS